MRRVEQIHDIAGVNDGLAQGALAKLAVAGIGGTAQGPDAPGVLAGNAGDAERNLAHLLGQAGDRFGVMKFGSRMDIFVPATASILVKVNDKVIGGVTVIARLRDCAKKADMVERARRHSTMSAY